MGLSIKKLLIGSLISLIALGGFTSVVFADPAVLGGNGYQCLGNEANRWKIENGSSTTLPSGYTIESVVVKAGQNCVTVYPTNTSSSCYTATIIGNQVSVIKIGSGPTCQDISHLEGTYSIQSTPTPTSANTFTPTPTSAPTPTATPSATATPTPTPTIIIPTITIPVLPTCPAIGASCNTGGTGGGGSTPTPTVTIPATPSSSPSATPTPTLPSQIGVGGVGDGRSDGRSDGKSDGKSSQPASLAVGGTGGGDPYKGVLGASTMAGTGSFAQNSMNAMLTLGMLSLSGGSILYAKSKKS